LPLPRAGAGASLQHPSTGMRSHRAPRSIAPGRSRALSPSRRVAPPVSALQARGVNRSGRELFINIPKLVVGKMAWEEPPRREATRRKQGPKAADVDKLYGSRSPTVMERP
jgi:hypothetical protein